MTTPILLLIYNRPIYTKKVFEAIRTIRPTKLYISADGPRRDLQNDEQMCDETRKVVSLIDWNCEVKTLFRNANLGCKTAVSEGINWFFEQVEQGIILEDDCLPNKSFFNYCEILLEKYKDESKVMMISGSNPATSVDVENEYFFSHFNSIWGWATWKRAWVKFDIKLSHWPRLKEERFLETIYTSNINNRICTEKLFDKTYNNNGSTCWAIQWSYTCIVNNGVSILPKHNLIQNIGFSGTHEMNNEQLSLETKTIDFSNFSHPKHIQVDSKIEDLLFEKSGLNHLCK